MMKTIFIFIFFLLPSFTYAFSASDFIVNSQATYEIPPGSGNVLILDLTLPELLQSIKIKNSGTALQSDIIKLTVFQDGKSAGWDGDENAIITKSSSPFWDTLLSGGFSEKRIFVTVDISSSAASTRTIKPRLEINSLKFLSGALGPTDKDVLGLERMIRAGTSVPTAPVAPLAGTPEVLSAFTIRWHFIDLSNNEFGFKILDVNLKEVIKKEEANLSYLDEIDLSPNTEYSGRRVLAFNDRGESLSYSLSVFPAAKTLSLPLAALPVAEKVEESALSPEVGGPLSAQEFKDKIQEIQLQIIDLLKQLIEILQQQLVRGQTFLAGLWITLLGK